jgi:GT2 family glycosyltransferase
MPASLSIIIVNYNSAGLIQNCITSIHQFTRHLAFEVIVVDNSSSKEDKEKIIQNFTEVRWIEMGYNAGFARANNEGIRQARGEVVLLLNPDILVEDNSIANCFFQFVNSGYVACGVQLLNPDHTPQISGNYAMKGGLNHLLPLPYLGNFLKSIATIFKWINGAFLMVKKSAIEKAGLLDEDFFLYAEEAEWCSRLKKTGKLCIYGQYSVIHLQGETANETFQSTGKGYYNLYDRKGLQIMVSNFVRIRKEFGIGWFLVQLFFYMIEVPVFFLGVCVEKILGKKNFSFRQAKGFTKNVVPLLKLSPTIIRNQPHFYKVL